MLQYKLDRIDTLTYPGGEVTTFAYDTNGNVNSLTGTSTYVSAVDYTPMGVESRIQYGNGVQAAYDYYDTASEYDTSAQTYYSYRLKGIQVTNGGTSLLNLSYKYDKAGNIKERQELNNSNLTEQYGYDALDRLTSATAQVYGTKTYGYDEINNIQTKDGRTYQYDSVKKYQVTSDGRYTYTYDNNGNIIGRSDGRIISWDYDNRVTALSDSGSFTYDAGGRRIKKVESGVTTLYFFDTYEEEYQGGTLTKTVKYYFVNGKRVAERSSTTGLRYYHQDHLSSSSAISDTIGNLILRTSYDPFGSNAYSQGSAELKYKYTDQEMDGSGLYYYGARFYDPELGRFISPDSVLDGLNRYAYCGNNPICYNDPTGHEFIGAVIGGLFGAICGGVVACWNGATFGDSQFWTSVGIGAVAGAIIGGLYIDPGTIAFSGGLTSNGVTVGCSFQLGSSAGGLAASGMGGAAAGLTSGGEAILASYQLNNQTNPTVVLDPGHGGTETGSKNGILYEDNINLQVATEVQGILEDNGIIVIMTRTTDINVNLEQRYLIANNIKADVFVSIHTNSNNFFKHGASIIIPANHCIDESNDLAYKIHMKIDKLE